MKIKAHIVAVADLGDVYKIEAQGSEVGSARWRSMQRYESPCAASTPEGIERNRRYLTACLRDSLLRNEAPFASHGLYVGPLDDNDPAERDHGIAAGFAWRHVAQATVVYVDLGTSRGMELGIEAAKEMGHPIEYRRLGGEWAET